MRITRLRSVLPITMLLLYATLRSQSLVFSPVQLTFNTPVLTTSRDSAVINIKNGNCGTVRVYYLYAPATAFVVNDTTGFVLTPNTSKDITVRFVPRQNIEYNGAVILHSSVGDFRLPVKGYGKFAEAYYDSTYNKFDEGLKSALNTILATNYTSYSYNAARDKMFMEFDNKKVNGQGATQNTLECAYTGRLAIGYTSRTDCQTNYDFNTEHTWPQSLFSSNLPMVSDLNHLFPTDEVANNVRGNLPFGMVSSPTWSVGGSKGTSSMFEPRDAQKGLTARAMLYFAVRYNNPSYGLVTFFGPQESILRTWCLQFPPDSIDRKRNNDIFGYQKNRNPFIDHPEFLERITSIANTATAPLKFLLWCDTASVNREVVRYDSLDHRIVLYNAGNAAVTFTKIQSSQGLFIVNYPGLTLGAKSSMEVRLEKIPVLGVAIHDTLVMENNSTNYPLIKIPVSFKVTPININATKNSIATQNDSSILTVTAKGSVTWSTGQPGNTLVVKSAGNYYAFVNDSLGCHRTDTVAITTHGVGITAASGEMGFRVYPNPASSQLVIDNLQWTIGQLIGIYNSIGETVFEGKLDSKRTTIDLSRIASGIYFVQIGEEPGIKIVVRH
jgi:hypothetical protein